MKHMLVAAAIVAVGSAATMRGSAWRAWLALKMVRGVGNVLGVGLVRAFGGPGGVLGATTHALECAGVRRDTARAIRSFDRWDEVDRQLARLDAVGGRLVTWDDESYPENLRLMADPPLFLFVRGEIAAADALAIAVVGSRTPSTYGRQMARVLSEGLVRYGVTVVSGLARGIDAEAHAGALRAGGRTIAVLGCGIDVVYPSEHHQLLMRILQHGCVASEFPMGTPPDPENFPTRNRIVSGLTLGTVVVEAADKSGALITAACALDQGREVFAVPGPVGVRSRGTHQLLRQGATLAESAEDLMAEIAPQVLATVRRPVAPPLSSAEAAVYGAVDTAATAIDQIITHCGLPAAQVLDVLLRLELRGLVAAQPGHRYARAGQ